MAVKTYLSDLFGPNKPAITPVGNEPVTLKAVVEIPANAVLGDGDILQLLTLPQGALLLALTLFGGDCDDDAAPAVVFDAGIMDNGDAALDTVFVSASTLLQAGGTLATPATTTMFETGALAAEKVLALEITTAAKGKAAAKRYVGAVVTYKV